MDIDDGYILWTGIWKGIIHSFSSLSLTDYRCAALGNSKGIHHVAPPGEPQDKN